MSSKVIVEPIETQEGLKTLKKEDGNLETSSIKDLEDYKRWAEKLPDNPKSSDINWPLPSSPKNYENESALLDELAEFFQAHAEISDRRYYRLLASFVLATWVVEDFDFATQLGFRGPPESGKTRVLELLKYTCYRGKLLSYSSEATIYRLIERYRSTLLIDEAKTLLNSDSAKEVINSGYKRGTEVAKADGPNYEVNRYRPFGFKAFSTLDGSRFPTIESRVIYINMRKAKRNLPINIDKNWARELRGKLLQFRLDNLGTFRE